MTTKIIADSLLDFHDVNGMTNVLGIDLIKYHGFNGIIVAGTGEKDHTERPEFI